MLRCSLSGSNLEDAWTYFVHPANVNPALAVLINDTYEYPNTNVDVQVSFYQVSWMYQIILSQISI